MAFALRDDEPAREGIRRCAAEELDSAIAQLSGARDGDPAAAVHRARKSLKKERALLRVVRPALGGGSYRRENATFRDAGRRLSRVRDADVALETIDALAARFAGHLPESAYDALRRPFEAEREALRPATGATANGASELVVELAAARDRIADWPLRAGGWRLIESGLKTAYRRGRRALDRAERSPTTENRHEWRKRVKDLWYDLRLLEPAWPALVGGQAEEAHALSELLGEDHDLAVLRERLSGQAQTPSNTARDAGVLVELIDLRRGQVFEQSRLLGRRLYAEKPGAFIRRMRRYWKTWRREAAAPAAVPPGTAGPRRERPQIRNT